MPEPKQDYQTARKAVKKHAEGGTFDLPNRGTLEYEPYKDPDDADRILKMADAYDENNLVVQPPEGTSTKSYSTLETYMQSLKKIAPHVALTDTDADELNRLMQDIYSGDADGFKDEGLSKGTVRRYQQSLRIFYKVHNDAGINPDDIPLYKKSSNDHVDPADMLTRDEIQAMRNAADCLRDRALFDFLIYTGQRNTAARSLRIKDLDLKNERFRLNSEADGLKGADENGTWRDLLLSAASIRDYLDTEHPEPDNPDAYVFTGRPKYGHANPESMLDVTTPPAILRKLSERAAEEHTDNDDIKLDRKPTHPHALRHNFVTIALRRGMSESAIKHQIGHDKSSNVMNTTYAHLKDSDHIREARDAFGKEVDEHESELTPEVCPKCGKNPPEDARVCPWCLLPFSPDARHEAHEKTTQTADSDDFELAKKLEEKHRNDPDFSLEESIKEILEKE